MHTHSPDRKAMSRPRNQHEGQEERAVPDHLGEPKVQSGCTVGCGMGGAHREGCCPHRTLERSAKQMVGSLIREQALRDGQVREEGLWLRGGEPGREATRGRTDSLGCCDVQWAMSNISGACGLEGNHICRMPGRAG